MKLGKEFDRADAAAALFHVMTFQRQATVQPFVVTDLRAHVMGVLNRGEIQIPAPDKRTHPGDK